MTIELDVLPERLLKIFFQRLCVLDDRRSVLVGEQRYAYGGRIWRLLGDSRTDGKTQPPDRAGEQKASTFHDLIHSMT